MHTEILALRVTFLQTAYSLAHTHTHTHARTHARTHTHTHTQRIVVVQKERHVAGHINDVWARP